LVRQIFWDILLKLADRYRSEAEQCLVSGSYLAGLVCVRAALETVFIARYLLELFNRSEKELNEYGFRVDEEQGLIEGVPLPVLKDLINQAYTDRIITKVGRDVAHRIREWGNKIHPVRIADQRRLPKISRRNLQARLRDLHLVIDQLTRTL